MRIDLRSDCAMSSAIAHTGRNNHHAQQCAMPKLPLEQRRRAFQGYIERIVKTTEFGSPSAIAKAADLHPSLINKALKEHTTHTPGAHTLKKIQRATGVSPPDILMPKSKEIAGVGKSVNEILTPDSDTGEVNSALLGGEDMESEQEFIVDLLADYPPRSMYGLVKKAIRLQRTRRKRAAENPQ